MRELEKNIVWSGEDIYNSIEDKEWTDDMESLDDLIRDLTHLMDKLEKYKNAKHCEGLLL